MFYSRLFRQAKTSFIGVLDKMWFAAELGLGNWQTETEMARVRGSAVCRIAVFWRKMMRKKRSQFSMQLECSLAVCWWKSCCRLSIRNCQNARMHRRKAGAFTCASVGRSSNQSDKSIDGMRKCPTKSSIWLIGRSCFPWVFRASFPSRWS